MKRTLLLLLALCVLLTGCGIVGGGDTPRTTEESGEATEKTSATEPKEEGSLLDGREAFDDTGALWYIPNALIEAQKNAALYAFANGLLMVTNQFISDGNSEVTLTLLSAATGEALQSRTVSTAGIGEVQLLDGYAVVSDSSAGTVVVLDEELREVARHTLAPDGGQWFLGTDLDTLYRCGYLDGIHAESLSTGTERFYFDMTDLSVCGVTDSGVCFTAVDRKTQRYGAFCLDLASGTLTEPPFSGDFSRINRSGEMWLGVFTGEENTVAFGSGDDARVAAAQEGSFSLLDPLGHLLFTGNNGELSIYDSTGAFLSSCALPNRYARNPVWREELGGYLLLVNGEEGSSLLFWDIGANTNGNDLQTQALSGRYAVPGGTSADASLYERAQALSDRFDVEIRIADQCETEYAYFSSYQVSDYASVSEGLDTLEAALSVFPEGFFAQLAYGHIDQVQFRLVGGLSATNGFGGDTGYAAFTDVDGNVCLIVLDIFSIGTNSVWHELSHAIDRRLAWDAMYRDNALFSEDGWLAYNPNNFAYSEDYAASRYDIPSEWYSYFVDEYAMINASEDRARVFENAIENSGTLFRNEGLNAKLQYYSACIRDCFETSQWPATTPWEAPLR